MPWIYGSLYLVCAVVVVAISDLSLIPNRAAADLPLWTFPISAAYWTSKILVVTGWFTLLPAFFIARKSRHILSCALVLFVGLLFGLFPIWEFESGAGLEVLVALVLSGLLAINLRSVENF